MTVKQVSGGYEFHYIEWKHPIPNKCNTRLRVSKDNNFSDDCECQMDGDLLKRMGLTLKGMQSKDLTIVDPSKSGIEDDPCLPYYTFVSNCTNSYAMDKKGWGGKYGNVFRNCMAKELINWDVCVACSTSNFIGDCWNLSKENKYNPVVDKYMQFC